MLRINTDRRNSHSLAPLALTNTISRALALALTADVIARDSRNGSGSRTLSTTTRDVGGESRRSLENRFSSNTGAVLAVENTFGETSSLFSIDAVRRDSLGDAPEAARDLIVGVEALLVILNIETCFNLGLSRLRSRTRSRARARSLNRGRSRESNTRAVLAIENTFRETSSLFSVHTVGGNSLRDAPEAARDFVVRIKALLVILNIKASFDLGLRRLRGRAGLRRSRSGRSRARLRRLRTNRTAVLAVEYAFRETSSLFSIHTVRRDSLRDTPEAARDFIERIKALLVVLNIKTLINALLGKFIG